MWSQRDPSLRRSGVGNVFIKNLDKRIDNKAFYDIFSAFGNILSCKVIQDENGVSKGYGFVQFEMEEAANKSIEQINGMLYNEKKIYVGRFISREERETAKRLTSLSVKNFEDLNDHMLKDTFDKNGHITSNEIVKTDDGRSRDLEFVAFEDPDADKQAVYELNDKDLVEEKPMHVGRAQKKVDCQQELKCKFELLKMERLNRYQGVNLYVKNLDDTIDDERLCKEFMLFGTITSAKVMLEDGRSKGFGFVCFSSSEEATKAVTEMNGRIVGTKPLYVALAQRKMDRKAHLASQHIQRMANMRMHQMGQIFPQTGTSGYFVPTLPQPQRLYDHAQVTPVRAIPHWPAQPQVCTNTQGNISAYQVMQNAYHVAPRVPGQVSTMHNVSSVARPITEQQPPNMQGRTMAGPGAVVNPSGRPANYKYTANMRNPPQQMPINQQAPVQQVVYIQGQEPLNATMLAAASLRKHKQMHVACPSGQTNCSYSNKKRIN